MTFLSSCLPGFHHGADAVAPIDPARYGHGSHLVATGRPARTASAWCAGSPPFGPYDAFMRAIVTGRPNARAQNRATASCPAFETE